MQLRLHIHTAFRGRSMINCRKKNIKTGESKLRVCTTLSVLAVFQRAKYISLQRWHPPAIPSGIGTQDTTNSKLKSVYVGYEALTTVVVKSSILWNITPCNTLKINLCFGETCRFHLQSRNQREARRSLLTLVSCLIYSTTLKMKACSSETSLDF